MRWAVLAGACMGVLFAAGCAPSLQAVYEGDVRFEHCMALDAQVRVKAQVRQQCWQEWVAFYTYGQTRDRVVHAQLRIRQLSGASDFVEEEPQSATDSDQPLAGPEPVTAMASPPATVPEGDEANDFDRCAIACRAERDDCSQRCGDGALPGAATSCRESCSAGFASCVRRCG